MPGPREDAAADTPGPPGRRTDRPRVGGDDEQKPPVDLSVQVEDAAGHVASVDLRRYGAIRRPLETRVMRRADQENRRFRDHWEQILQTYSIPLGDFLEAAPDLDLRTLATVRLVFDRAVRGEVVVDQIGLSNLDPAFLTARVER